MGKQIGRAIQPRLLSFCDSYYELFCVPINDDCCQKIEIRDTEMLSFRCAMQDFILTPDPKCVF